MTLVEALVAIMLQWTPYLEGSDETPEQTLTRYTAIAEDAVAVAASDPLPTKGLDIEQRAQKTAVFLLATASLESHFDDAAVSRTGDKCIMQVHPMKGENVDTRLDCLRVGLARIHYSFLTCSPKSKDWLSPYKSGKCYQNQKDARVNLARAAWGYERLTVLTSPKKTKP